MKNGLVILLILCIGCNAGKQKESHANEVTPPDYIIDTTLTRVGLDFALSFETSRMPKNWSGEVTTGEQAYKIAEQEMHASWGKKDIDAQKPFLINLIDNKIWVISGTLHQPDDGTIIFGWTVYMEISKENGEIIRIGQEV